MNETSGAGFELAQAEPVQQAALSRGFKLISGTANRALSVEIAEHLGVDLAKVTLTRFADGEIFVRIDENIRGRFS